MIRDVCKPIRWCLGVIAAALATCLAFPALAQIFPERTVKLIVPVPPGGSTDAIARMVTLRMQAILGQPLSFSVGLYQDGNALEQYPPHRPLDVAVPGWDFGARYWSV